MQLGRGGRRSEVSARPPEAIFPSFFCGADFSIEGLELHAARTRKREQISTRPPEATSALGSRDEILRAAFGDNFT